MSRLLLAVSCLILPFSASAEVKGIQAVLLHCWNSRDLPDLTGAVSHNFTSSPFAISSAPFIASTRGCKINENNRLDNLASAISQLRGAGVALHVITYMGGLHDTGLANNKDMVGTLSGNFGMFFDKIISTRFTDSSVTFLVGASLEDEYANADAEEPNDALNGVLAGILRRKGEKDDSAAVARVTLLLSLVRQNRLFLVRGPDPGNTPSKPDFDSIPFQFKLSLASGKIDIPVLHEAHGPKPEKIATKSGKTFTFRSISGYKIWSNDGPLVAYDCENYGVASTARKMEICGDCDTFGDPQTISTFRSATPSPGGYRLLWRPVYNMFTRAGDSYKNPGADRPAVEVSFGPNQRERNVLTRFVSGTCPAS